MCYAFGRFLCTGLWPEAVIVLLNLRLQVNPTQLWLFEQFRLLKLYLQQLGISVVRIENVVKSFAWKYNRYGLLRLGDVPAVISEATVEGIGEARLCIDWLWLLTAFCCYYNDQYPRPRSDVCNATWNADENAATIARAGCQTDV